MLVDNKFIYISIPRCATTSFLVSCFKNKIDVKHFDNRFDFDYQLNNNDFIKTITDIEELSNNLKHCHEPLPLLESKFGKNYDIISVRRNRYERFISSWKHCIHEIIRSGDTETANILKKLDENQILDFNAEILQTDNIKNPNKFSQIFIDKFKLKSNSKYLNEVFFSVFIPTSYTHQNNNKIIWFDFNELDRMEEWVSEKLNKNFKLVKSNSSNKIDCNLKLTENFIKKYNSIYDRFEIIKNEKSIL
jgi:hypothetical protein